MLEPKHCSREIACLSKSLLHWSNLSIFAHYYIPCTKASPTQFSVFTCINRLKAIGSTRNTQANCSNSSIAARIQQTSSTSKGTANAAVFFPKFVNCTDYKGFIFFSTSQTLQHPTQIITLKGCTWCKHARLRHAFASDIAFSFNHSGPHNENNQLSTRLNLR